MIDGKSKFSILLVDDEIDLLEATRDTIDAYFEKVFIASSVHGALEILTKEQVNIVLCDLNMPHQDGLLLRNIMVQNHPGVHFALLTGYSDDPRIEQALASDKFPVLDKPTRPDVLVNRLLTMLLGAGKADLSKSNFFATETNHEEVAANHHAKKKKSNKHNKVS